METPISPDDRAVKGCAAMLRFMNYAPTAKAEKNRREYVRKILHRYPDEAFPLAMAVNTNPNPPSFVVEADRDLFTFATSTADVVIGEYAPPYGDTPERRESALQRFMSRCGELAPHAAVVVVMPNAAAPVIDEDALDAAINTYFSLAKRNAEAEARRERARARLESEARQ